MPIQSPSHSRKDKDQNQREKDEIGGDDRVGDEGVERLIREVIGVIKRVTLLPPRWEAGKEHQRGCVKQEDRFVSIAFPRQTQHRRKDDPAEFGGGFHPNRVSGLDIASGDRLKRPMEDLRSIGGGVQEQNDQRAKPGFGQPTGLYRDLDEAKVQIIAQLWDQNEGLVSDETLDTQRRYRGR